MVAGVSGQTPSQVTILWGMKRVNKNLCSGFESDGNKKLLSVRYVQKFIDISCSQIGLDMCAGETF